MKKESLISIGIDPGTKTGYAAFSHDTGKLVDVKTLKIHQALSYTLSYLMSGRNIEIIIENPNTWIHFKGNKTSDAKKQGAGSIKRDYAIWRDFCEDWKIPMRGVKLQGTLKKIDEKLFRKITSWDERTSEHARDAAMLVFSQRKAKNFEQLCVK